MRKLQLYSRIINKCEVTFVMTKQNILKKLGVRIPTVYLPNKNVDLYKWSVVACDQYTSQPEYWNEVEKIVGNNPSTLHLTLPEVYLESNDVENYIKKINQTMKEYLNSNILLEQKTGFIYIDRKTSHSTSRKGLLINIDLEKYDYSTTSQSLVRATEGTVVDRLPPRIKIRRNATIETSHIMLLIDDPQKTVIEPLSNKLDKLQKLYDFELMMNGMHIKGYKIEDTEIENNIIESIESLASNERFKNTYPNARKKNVLLFAAGDGNHSLATAKEHWNFVKSQISEKESENHPARFALVEIVNVYDEGLKFEPIHRVIFNTSYQDLLYSFTRFYNNSHYKLFDSKTAFKKELSNISSNKSTHIIPFILKNVYGILLVPNPTHNLEVATLQLFLDNYIKSNPKTSIDYIHGEDVLNALCSKEQNLGFILPAIDKHDLFKTVVLEGVLPRKTFSMGEAEEKRFYLECRKIVL